MFFFFLYPLFSLPIFSTFTKGKVHMSFINDDVLRIGTYLKLCSRRLVSVHYLKLRSVIMSMFYSGHRMPYHGVTVACDELTTLN